jgi:hypothetical protein
VFRSIAEQPEKREHQRLEVGNRHVQPSNAFDVVRSSALQLSSRLAALPPTS